MKRQATVWKETFANYLVQFGCQMTSPKPGGRLGPPGQQAGGGDLKGVDPEGSGLIRGVIAGRIHR